MDIHPAHGRLDTDAHKDLEDGLDPGGDKLRWIRRSW